MDPDVATDLLSMAMAGAKEGSVKMSDMEGEWR